MLSILGPRDKAVGKVDRLPFLVELTSVGGGENKNKQNFKKISKINKQAILSVVRATEK